MDIHIWKDGRIEVREPRAYEAPQVTEYYSAATNVHWRVEVERTRAHGVQVLVER